MNTDRHRVIAARVKEPESQGLAALQSDNARYAIFVLNVLPSVTQFTLIRRVADDSVFAQVCVLRATIGFYEQRKAAARLLIFHVRKTLAPFALACRIPNPNLRRGTPYQRIEICPNAKRDNLLSIDQNEMYADRARIIKFCDGTVAVLLANFRGYDRHVGSMVVSAELSNLKKIVSPHD